MKTVLFAAFVLVSLVGCKTKSDVIREQQIRRMQKELHQVKTNRADGSVQSQELQMEITRLSSLIELQSQQMERLTDRVARLESQTKRREAKKAAAAKAAKRASYSYGQELFKKGRYKDAAATLKQVIRNSRPKSAEARKSQFLLAECYFANKQYALAALEYAQYKKGFPKDSLVPRAIYQQANSFRKMGKKKEAKLFYSELLERFPRHSLASNAKRESRALK